MKIKAALIIDIPRCCSDCILGYENEYAIEFECFAEPHKHLEEPDCKRPDWCPLRELPEKHNIDATQVGEEWAVFNKGWNACIDEIMKQS